MVCGAMFMQTLITGLVSLAVAGSFLGWMAYDVGEWPFVIVTLIGIVAMFADVIQSLRRPDNNL